jgi:hypothetical protein
MLPLIAIAVVALFAMGGKKAASKSTEPTMPTTGAPPADPLYGRGADAVVYREPRPEPQSVTSLRPFVDLGFAPPQRPTRRRNSR